MPSEFFRRIQVKQCGLTLVELLVAISVMGFIAMLGWRGLDSLARARASLNSALAQTRGLQLTFAQLQSDCLHVVSSDELDGRAPLQIGTSPWVSLRLVRRTQPEARASALQLVTYRLRDGLLTREASPPTRDLVRLEHYLQNTQPVFGLVRLQSGVQLLQLRLWADDGQGWRNAQSVGSSAPTSRAALMNPRAGITTTQVLWRGLEVSLRLPDQRDSLTKIFMVGSV